MSDISVGKSNFSDNKKVNENSGKYSSIKREYTKFKKISKKSDMVNSSTYIEKELEILGRLMSAAQSEGKTKEVEEINKQITQLLIKLSYPQMHSNLPKTPYYKPILHSVEKKEEPISFTQKIEAANIEEEIIPVDIMDKQPEPIISSEDEEAVTLDEDAQKLLSLFQKDGRYHALEVLRISRNIAGDISPDIMTAAANLSETGASANVFIEFIETFSKKDDKKNKTIDLSLTKNFEVLYKGGFNDIDSLRVLCFIQSNNFQSPDEIENYAINLLNTGIDTNTIIDILNKLKTKDTNSKKNKILNSSIINVQLLKRSMAKTRDNEKNEINCPINKLGRRISKLDESSVLISIAGKDSKIIEKNPNISVREVQQYINDKLSNEENSVLLNFVKKFTKRNGELDINALRCFTSLRRFGITNKEILQLTDYCIDKDKLNTEKLNLIFELKKAGALSKDIIQIIDAIGTDKNGNFNEENKKNALDLTSAVIGGKEVVSLLPTVRGKKDVKEFVSYLSQIFENRADIVSLVSLIKKNDDTVDEVAMEILYKLTGTFCDTNNSKIRQNDFVDAAEAIIQTSINPSTSMADEDAASICSILCNNGEPIKNIFQAINLCKNEKGEIDVFLAELLWKMGIEHADFDDIKSVITQCKDEDGFVNTNFVNMLLSLMDKKHSIRQIIETAKTNN